MGACGRQTGLLRPVLVFAFIKGVLRLYEAYTTSYGHCLFSGYVRVVADGMFFIPAAATRFVSAASFFVFRGAVYSFPGFFAAIHFRMDFFCFFHAVYLSSPFLRKMCQKEAKFLEISGNLAYHDNVTGRCSSCGLFSTGRAIINQTLRKQRPVRFLFQYRRNGPVFYHPVRDV